MTTAPLRADVRKELPANVTRWAWILVVIGIVLYGTGYSLDVKRSVLNNIVGFLFLASIASGSVFLIALDEGLARQAAMLGAKHRLRGADAVYLATASLFATELVTLDKEQLHRGAGIVPTLEPSAFVATT